NDDLRWAISSPIRPSFVIRKSYIEIPMSSISASPFTGLDADRFNTHLAQRSYLPAWWIAAKQEAWNEFVARPMPKRTDENWRFANLSGLALDGFIVP